MNDATKRGIALVTVGIVATAAQFGAAAVVPQPIGLVSTGVFIGTLIFVAVARAHVRWPS